MTTQLVAQLENPLTPINADHAASNVSRHYGFISSKAIVESLQDIGFVPRKIHVASTKTEAKKGFQRHIVRMQHSSLMPSVGDSFPEICLTNSHDRTCALSMTLGLYRLVCSNGMVSGRAEHFVKFMHRAVNIEQIMQAATSLADRGIHMSEIVARMKERRLSDAETAHLVENAAMLRYNKPVEGVSDHDDFKLWNRRLSALQTIRRSEDDGQNLWLTFNRIQENLTQGRIRSGVRAISSPKVDMDVNKKLWTLAETLLN
jgi:hypothetical protein